MSDGTASLSADQLNGLTITPPTDSDANFSLTVAATATESDGGTATTEATVAVDVEAVADAPTLTVELGNGVENPWFDAKVTVTNKGDHSAGYHNSYGYYVMDENGNPTEGRVIWADQHAAADDAAYDIEGIDPDKVGFFDSNGDNLNDSIVDGMAVTFTRNSEGDWVVVDPSGHELEGKGACSVQRSVPEQGWIRLRQGHRRARQPELGRPARRRRQGLQRRQRSCPSDDGRRRH